MRISDWSSDVCSSDLLNLLLLDLDLRLGLGLSGLRSRNLRRLDLGFLSGFLLLFRGSARSEGQRGGDRKGDAVLHGDDAWLDQAKAMLHVEIPFDLDSAILAGSRIGFDMRSQGTNIADRKSVV